MTTRSFLLRDPLWNTIRLDPAARRIVNSAAFQRLRHVRQLGLAHLVYPGATHTRFDHALGVYHLARRALDGLEESGALGLPGGAAREEPGERPGRGLLAAEAAIIPYACLLHDIGHYPFSHALEEIAATQPVGHHEAVVGRFLADEEVRAALDGVVADAPALVEALITGRSDNPLQGLVNGSMDLDKIEYLKRDARFCGVPYGEVDVDRLLHALTLVEDPISGRLEVGVEEKGVAALESLLFAKYQMFRNVYWHHAVRAATVLYKRIVSDAVETGVVSAEELIGQTDEGLLHLLESRSRAALEAGGRGAATTGSLVRKIGDLRLRRLPKRVAEIAAGELEGAEVGEWVAGDTPLKRRVEARLAAELGMEEGAVFLDYPEKSRMFELDLLVRRRDGSVIRVGEGGRSGLIGLPRIAGELYRSARVLRLFVAGGRPEVSPSALAELAILPDAALSARIDSGEPLL